MPSYLKYFKYFSKVLLTIAIMWVVCGVLTATNVFPAGHPARTDLKLNIIEDAPWFRVPYPGNKITCYFNNIALFVVFNGSK